MTDSPKGTFSRSIEIAASPQKVWNAVLHPNGQWGKAFGDGATADTDWSNGSKIIWRDAENNVVASGIVEEHRPGSYLKLHYHDEAELNPNTPLGDYCETFSVVGTENNSSTLSIKIGAMAESDMPVHQGMWNKALNIIKELAES